MLVYYSDYYCIHCEAPGQALILLAQDAKMLASSCDIQRSFSSSVSLLLIVIFLPLSPGICRAGAATPMSVLILILKLVLHPGIAAVGLQ